MFGDISAWFYKALAGINPDPAAPGFKHIIIKPHAVGDLTFARATYDSVRGRIESAWRIEHGQFHLHLIIPPNTTATVYMPKQFRDRGQVMEGGRSAGSREGIRPSAFGDGVFEIGSGSYEFSVPVSL